MENDHHKTYKLFVRPTIRLRVKHVLNINKFVAVPVHPITVSIGYTAVESIPHRSVTVNIRIYNSLGRPHLQGITLT